MKKLLLLFATAFLLCGCGESANEPFAYHVKVVDQPITYNVLTYKRLSIYLYGNLVGEWYEGRGYVPYNFRYLDSLTLTVSHSELTVQGYCNYDGSDAGPYVYTYGGTGYTYQLYKRNY